MPTREVFFYWLTLLAANCLCFLQYRRLKRADRYILFFLITTLVVEVAAYELLLLKRDNLLLYEIFNPAELLLLCLYFDRALRFFRRSHLAAVIGLLSIGFSYSVTLFLKPGTWVSDYFLLYEATLIITFCLLALYEILMDEDRIAYRFANFWVTVCLLSFWSITFTGWGILPVISGTDKHLAHIIHKVLQSINYLLYTGLALVFFRYKKLIPSGA